MLNEGPLEEMHPKLCADPCRLTGLKRRHELNEHLVDRIKLLASGRVSVLLLSTGEAISVPSTSLVPIPKADELRLSRRDAPPAVLRRLLEAALLAASDRKSLDVSDLVEAVLRWLVLPPVDLAQVRSTGASSSCEHGPCHHSHLLDPATHNWWISETQPETRGRGEWVQFTLGEEPVLVDYFHMTIPPLPGGPLSVRSFYLQVAPTEEGPWSRATVDLMTHDVPGRQWWHLVPQVETRFVRVVCLVNAATYGLLSRPGRPLEELATGGPDFARCVGFFSCGFA